MRITLGQLAAMLECNVDSTFAHREIRAVCRDTREVVHGCLFVCIVGNNHDGHDYAAKAVELGAAALLVGRYIPNVDVPQLLVPAQYNHDTVKGLGRIAHCWRKQFAGKVVGITGSAGKTTVKEVLADVLSKTAKVARSIKNYNNQVGMPLSIVNTEGNEDYWIMEVGISEAHDMHELGAILEPDAALILNVARAHTEGLSMQGVPAAEGEKGVAYHKSRLFAHVAEGGVAIASADYADLTAASAEFLPNIYTFSGQDTCTQSCVGVSAKYMGLTEAHNQEKKITKAQGIRHCGVYAVTIAATKTKPMQTFTMQSPFIGSYGAENVAAIVSVCVALGIDVPAMQQGLAQARLPEQRFEVHVLHESTDAQQWIMIDDSYNANPLSMKRMLQASAEIAQESPLYAILGTMAELGSVAEEEHEKLGQFMAHELTRPLCSIFWKGPYAQDVHKGLQSKGFTGGFVVLPDACTPEEFLKIFSAQVRAAGVVLCKGSRSNKLEFFAQALLKKYAVEKEG